MTEHSETGYECFECNAMFRKHVFGLNRQFERVGFGTSMPVIDVEHSDGLTCYCSDRCMNIHFPKEMVNQGVPIPAVRPDIGPVEVCAVCKGPVDMLRWHLTFVLEEFEDMGWCAQPKWSEYVAVVCNYCTPRSDGAAFNTRKSHEKTTVSS